MTFMDNFLARCQARGESPSHALEAAGLSKSILTRWRDYPNRVPSGTTVKKLADYFGCTFEDLLYSGPVFTRSETAMKIQSAVDQMDEKQQEYVYRFVQFLMENPI